MPGTHRKKTPGKPLTQQRTPGIARKVRHPAAAGKPRNKEKKSENLSRKKRKNETRSGEEKKSPLRISRSPSVISCRRTVRVSKARAQRRHAVHRWTGEVNQPTNQSLLISVNFTFKRAEKCTTQPVKSFFFLLLLLCDPSFGILVYFSIHTSTLPDCSHFRVWARGLFLGWSLIFLPFAPISRFPDSILLKCSQSWTNEVAIFCGTKPRDVYSTHTALPTACAFWLSFFLFVWECSRKGKIFIKQIRYCK